MIWLDEFLKTCDNENEQKPANIGDYKLSQEDIQKIANEVVNKLSNNDISADNGENIDTINQPKNESEVN